MEAFFVSIGTIALAELGDKTMLLALALAARYRAPLQIILGVLIATLANHAIAGALGAWIQDAVGGDVLRYVAGGVFIALGLWMLIPDKPTARTFGEDLGPLIATIISFFIAEMGDKTQIATLALASHAHSLLLVIIGTTIGMMVVNVPVVYVGNFVAEHLPIGLIRGAAVAVFVIVGGLILAGVDFGLTPAEKSAPTLQSAPEPEDF
jgi:putative Ca2+/H+ antiporter (TMEM165/GDT1 family)